MNNAKWIILKFQLVIGGKLQIKDKNIMDLGKFMLNIELLENE